MQCIGLLLYAFRDGSEGRRRFSMEKKMTQQEIKNLETLKSDEFCAKIVSTGGDCSTILLTEKELTRSTENEPGY